MNDGNDAREDAAQPQPPSEEGVRFTLRASSYLFSLIDRFRARRPGKISRNTWILEAITEKLKREQDDT